MLRYYDEYGLLKPAKIDKFTGYRLYSVEQVSLLQKIIMLRDLNFGVSEIAKVLENWKDDFILEQLQSKVEESRKIIHNEEMRIESIKSAIVSLKNRQINTHYNITIKSTPSYKVLSLRKKLPNYFYESELWEEMYQYMKQEQITLVQRGVNNMSIYYDEEHKESDVDVEVAVVVNEFKEGKEGFFYHEIGKVDTMASMMVCGPFDKLGGAYQSFVYWLEANPNYRMSGLSRQISLKGPWDEEDPKEFITEIQIPITRNG